MAKYHGQGNDTRPSAGLMVSLRCLMSAAAIPQLFLSGRWLRLLEQSRPTAPLGCVCNPPLIILVLTLSGPPGWAADDADTGLDPDEIPRWDTTVNLRSWGGYKDNVTFNHNRPASSGYLGAGLDFFLWKLPGDGAEIQVIGTGEFLRYLADDAPRRETFAFLQTQVAREFTPHWKAAITAEFLHFDQPVDVSLVERDLNIVQIQGQSYTLRPSLRRIMPDGWFIEGGASLARQHYGTIVDDEWQPGATATIGRSYGVRSELSLGYDGRERLFDTRVPRSAAGTALPSGSLRITQHEVVGQWRHHWDRNRRWRTLTRASCQMNSDNASGYYDHTRWRLSQQVRYEADTWSTRVELKFTRYDYDWQPADPGALSPRKKDVFQATWRGERRLTKRWKLFGEYEYQRSAANLSIEDYRASHFFAGLDCEL